MCVCRFFDKNVPRHVRKTRDDQSPALRHCCFALAAVLNAALSKKAVLTMHKENPIIHQSRVSTSNSYRINHSIPCP